MTPVAVVAGAGVWLAIVAGVALWLAAVAISGDRLFGPRAVLRWFLSCWMTRIMLLAFWGAAGWHVFCQRP